jgi:hypothetical protein
MLTSVIEEFPESRKRSIKSGFMELINRSTSKMQNCLLALFAFAVIFSAQAVAIYAHNGEDHGDEKPKVATAVKGTVSRSARLGEFEITLKHPELEPDTATSARLFVTRFQTNEAVGIDAAAPTVQIESPAGTVTQVAAEKTDVPGSYILKIPALGEGNYTVRAGLKTGSGSDTATFSGVNVAGPAAEDGARGASWLRTVLLFLTGAVVLGLFGVLFYFTWHLAGGKPIGEESASV